MPEAERVVTEAERVSREYRMFAVFANGSSPLYEQLANAVASDEEVIGLLLTLPKPKRQPNLLFAAARWVTGIPTDYRDFRARLLERRATIVDTMLTRRTQTNEPGRCAALYPVLVALPQPVALLEVGASAGLCLLPDRYRYDYRTGDGTTFVAGDPTSSVHIDCRVEGPFTPPGPLEVAWRAGIDAHPLSVNDPDHVAWLESLVWPGHDERVTRLRQAIELARASPAPIVSGDLNDRLAEVAAQAPPDATLVVFHTAVLTYLTRADRTRMAHQVRDLEARWLSQEAPDVLPWIAPPVESPRTDAFVLAVDGAAVAYTSPHGGWVRWLVDPATPYR